MLNYQSPPASKVIPDYNLGYIWAISLVAALGGLLFGYDWVVIGGAKPFFEKYFQLGSEQLVGWANSCALVGCLIGSLGTGAISDRLGRKRLLVGAAVLFGISSILTGWAPTFRIFVLWRIAGGVAIGMASGLSPMYIAEVAPAHLRGRLVAINQLTIVVGILAAQCVNLLIAQKVTAGQELLRDSWNCQFAWRWMFTAVTAPSLLFVAGALWAPESPRWLIKNGNRDRARPILARIGGEAYADEEIRAVQETLESAEIRSVHFGDLLDPRLFRILVIGIALAVLQQWSGINVIFNYAEELYKAAGYGVNDILFNIVITGTINLAVTVVAIMTVDRLGRRALMLVGCAAIAISHLLLAGAYVKHLHGWPVLILTLCAIGSYGLSLAPITWVLISEIFPNRIRGAATSVAVSALWIACFVLTYTFPVLNKAVGMAGTFAIYATICLAGLVFVALCVPETKGKTLEQIEQEFSR